MMNLSNFLKGKKTCILDVFLNCLKVKHTREFTSRYYEEHPHKYNLYGLSLMMSEYGIENAGVQIKDKNNISKIQTPFIAHLSDDQFAVVYSIKNDNVNYVVEGDHISISIKEFIRRWSGIILIGEPNKESIEPNFHRNHIRELFHRGIQIFLVVSLLIVIFCSSKQLFTNWYVTSLLIINASGIYLGYLLLLKHLKLQSNYAEKLCSLFKKSNCDNVLESDSAYFLGVFSWSEIGFSYFISNTILILLFPEFLSYLSIVNLCTLAYSFWSIWYQKYRLKQWCPICLIVMTLFWLQFFVNIFWGAIHFFTIEFFEMLIIGAIYMLIYSTVSLFVFRLSDNQTVKQLVYRINNIKTDETVFSALLMKQPHFDISKSTSHILFGNPDAKTIITLVSDPHCGSCIRMHSRVEHLLNKMGDQVCVQYVFFSSYSPRIQSCRFLVSAYFRNERNKAQDILNQWFKEGHFDNQKFFSRYSYNTDDNDVRSEFLAHRAFVEKTNLRATPTILVNGYLLPNMYKIEDLTILNL